MDYLRAHIGNNLGSYGWELEIEIGCFKFLLFEAYQCIYHNSINMNAEAESKSIHITIINSLVRCFVSVKNVMIAHQVFGHLLLTEYITLHRSTTKEMIKSFFLILGAIFDTLFEWTFISVSFATAS